MSKIEPSRQRERERQVTEAYENSCLITRKSYTEFRETRAFNFYEVSTTENHSHRAVKAPGSQLKNYPNLREA